MTDEIWTIKDGTKIAVGDMDESHVRNTLRMILRKRREKAQRKLDALLPNDCWEGRPDNHQQLTALRREHGSNVRTEGKSVAGMGGADVYVGDRWIGWFGGIR